MEMPSSRHGPGQKRLEAFAGLPVHHLLLSRIKESQGRLVSGYITRLLPPQSALQLQKVVQLEKVGGTFSVSFLMPSVQLPSMLAF